jgi:large subunit ribosomal protein L7A
MQAELWRMFMSNEKVARFNKQHVVVGLKETLKALKKDQVTALIIAKDVEVFLLSRVFSYINHTNIPVYYFESKQALGKYVGINVNATIVALLNEN